MPFDLPEGLLPGGRYAEWAPARPAYLVADVDGTLIGPSPQATHGVVAAAQRAAQGGLVVGFATGRMRLAVEPLWAQLRLPGPHVLHNGAEVRADGATVASWPLSDRELDAVLATADELGAYAELYTPDGYHVTVADERARPHWALLGRDPLSVVSRREDLAGAPVLKATFGLFGGIPPGELVDRLQSVGLRASAAGSPLTPTITYINATDPAVDKGEALRVAVEHLGVELAETVCVGDAPNDLPMLALVGTAVAMGQSPDEVRAGAHVVVPEVDADGVAHAIDACLAWRR